jgi:hypothetical protein
VDLSAFIEKWSKSNAAERANKDSFLLDLCAVLEVATPEPTTADPERDRYVFERDAVLVAEGEKRSVGKVDLYKDGCFLLEAKQGSDAGSGKLGTAKRGTAGWNVAMHGAYGQALGYARTFDRPPPFLVTCDIGHCFDLYACFDGTADYRPFPNAQNRVFLRDLAPHVATFRAIFLDPHSLDPSRRSAKVTREVAAHIAELAKELEAAGHGSEVVAAFLMRCLFTMFAEDVGLLPERLFVKALEDDWIPHPEKFQVGVTNLWSAMNHGGFWPSGKLLRFNGGLFADPSSLPLTKPHMQRLLEAARCSWADVEPAIFGTLIERALDPRERHALGAHYTPRAYIERQGEAGEVAGQAPRADRERAQPRPTRRRVVVGRGGGEAVSGRAPRCGRERARKPCRARARARLRDRRPATLEGSCACGGVNFRSRSRERNGRYARRMPKVPNEVRVMTSAPWPNRRGCWSGSRTKRSQSTTRARRRVSIPSPAQFDLRHDRSISDGTRALLRAI